ncbi:centrosomal protein 89kDa [Glossina fuscipes fuscipes]
MHVNNLSCHDNNKRNLKFMKSMTATQSRHQFIITDLDQSDTQEMGAAATATTSAGLGNEKQCKTHKRRIMDKTLHTLSGNFSRRSQSVECCVQERLAGKPPQRTSKVTNYFNELLQSKDQQMEKLLERLAILHKFNEQFADENQRLLNEAKLLQQQIASLQRQIAECERCRSLENDLLKKAEDNKQLTADVEMMKTLTFRLNVQIEYYQDMIRRKKLNEEGAKSSNVSPHQAKSNVPEWPEGQVRGHTLDPLLKAYDEMLRDKEELIKQYSEEFEQFAGDFKRILEENDRLQQQTETLRRDGGNWREEKTCLQAQLDVCRQKAEVQTKKTELTKEKLVEVMHTYEQKIQTLLLDMQHMQSAYTRCKGELAALKSAAAIPQDTIANSLKECKELLEQLRNQHSKEKMTLEQTIVELNEHATETVRKLEQLKSENATLTSKFSDLEAQAEEQKKRCTHLQKESEKLKHSRDSLKARLRIALQWTHKLEAGQTNLQHTWDALKRLETMVRHKESQVRGLHARHLEEIDKMEKKLAQREETIRNILRDRLTIKTKS